jgi:hypothetical protein
MTVHNVEDTIVGGTYFSTDNDDTEYEPNLSAFCMISDSDVQSDEEDSPEEVEEESPAIGSVISSQASLLGQEYGSDSESSSNSSLAASQPRLTRLQRIGSSEPLEHGNGLFDSINASNYSSNNSSDTDSDTSDDDVLYHNCEGEEPSVEDYAKQKHTKIRTIPTKEALVSYCSINVLQS